MRLFTIYFLSAPTVLAAGCYRAGGNKTEDTESEGSSEADTRSDGDSETSSNGTTDGNTDADADADLDADADSDAKVSAGSGIPLQRSHYALQQHRPHTHLGALFMLEGYRLGANDLQ